MAPEDDSAGGSTGDAYEGAERRVSSLSRDDALAGTTLFVRYEDTTDGTLEHAVEGRIDESALRSNLHLAAHTAFEADGVTVDGRSFGSFLRDAPEYRFVEWLLTALLYEIRRTGTSDGLSKLYASIERIDRIDFDGDAVTDGTGRDSASFDLVVRDERADPLVIATFGEDGTPTGAVPVDSFVERASRVAEATGTLAAAFFVTSRFATGATEVAAEATRGGLFSRTARRSFVTLSRQRGFHLCLVEAQDETCHLTVPDL
ncbi:hypothetical protein ACFR97_05875 [Haloplanus litoreus]|uniref:DUF7527 domain-containing protein n=1 Tax=Haloplanus litoreus TaxID=767515 RepID=A0ABD5ZXF7_9EURY